MPNLSPYFRRVAAGAGAAFMAALASPLAYADVDSAYGDLAVLYSDASAFSNSFGAYEDLLFDSDLSQNILTTSGIGVGDAFPSGATASQDMTATVGEGNTLTGQLGVLEDYQPASVVAATDGKELAAIGDAASFQDQVNSAVADLPAITVQDQTNPLLIAYLSALFDNELNLGTYLTNLGDSLDAGSPAGLTGDNADILTQGLGILADVQGTGDTLTLLADLSSLGL